MMLKLLLIFTVMIGFQQQVLATNACVVEKPNQSLEGLLRVVKELTPEQREISKEYCWALKVCEESMKYDEESGRETYKFESETMPKDFACGDNGRYQWTLIKTPLSFSCGMTLEERLSIEEYTGSAYRCMNAYLREKKTSIRGMEYYIKTLNRALDKLPNYEGVVIRGADLPQEIAAKHKKGSVVTYEAFTSTSTNSGFVGDQFIIFSKTGKPIMQFGVAEEYEILFKSGTRFKILDVIPQGRNKIYVMKEITCGPGSAQERKEDEELIKKIKDGIVQENDWTPDKWACPEEVVPKVPAIIRQKALPKILIDKSDKGKE